MLHYVIHCTIVTTRTIPLYLFFCNWQLFILAIVYFGLQTVGYDPLIPGTFAAKFGIEFMELEQLWPIVDFITVHTPLMPSTQGDFI